MIHQLQSHSQSATESITKSAQPVDTDAVTRNIYFAVGDVTKPISTLKVRLFVDHELGCHWQIVCQSNRTTQKKSISVN